MLSVALLLLALLAGAFGASSTAIVSVDGLSFQTDVNVTSAQSDDRFHFRKISLTSLLGAAVLYTSLEVDATGNDNGGSVSVDTIVGVAYASPSAILALGSPAAWLAYFTAEANIDITNIGLDSSVAGTAGLLGKVFAKIEEVTPSGTVISTSPLKNRNWSLGNIVSSGSNGELKYATFSSTDDGFDVDITVAVSAVLGKLNVGDATITPRNLESFVEIRNYPYGNVANNLRLTIFLGHAAAKASATYEATGTIIAGSGNEQIYFKLAGSAVVDGESVSVTVSGLDKSDLSPSDIDQSIFQGQLTAAGDLSSEIRQVVVDFPAGATLISYDPTIGFGAPNAAGLLLPSFGALLLSIAVFFFAF